MYIFSNISLSLSLHYFCLQSPKPPTNAEDSRSMTSVSPTPPASGTHTNTLVKTHMYIHVHTNVYYVHALNSQLFFDLLAFTSSHLFVLVPGLLSVQWRYSQSPGVHVYIMSYMYTDGCSSTRWCMLVAYRFAKEGANDPISWFTGECLLYCVFHMVYTPHLLASDLSPHTMYISVCTCTQFTYMYTRVRIPVCTHTVVGTCLM